MGHFSTLASAFTGSQGVGLGKDENLALLANKLQLSNIGVQAAKDLQSFYQTGTLPGTGYTAGESYTGALGEYELDDLEKLSSSKINDLVQQGIPELSTLGSSEIKDLLTTDKYNPLANKDTYFKPYKAEIMEEYGNLSDELDRQLAVTGDFYSTNRSNQQRKLSESTGRQMNTLLSNLYQNYMTHRLQGAEAANKMAQAQQNMQLKNIAAAQQQGALERTLKDTQAKESYNEWLRQRSEYGDILNTAMSLYSGTPASSAFDQAGAGKLYTRPSAGDRLAIASGEAGDEIARVAMAMLTGGSSEISGMGATMFGDTPSGVDGSYNWATSSNNIFA